MTPMTLNHSESKCVLANLKHELAPKDTTVCTTFRYDSFGPEGGDLTRCGVLLHEARYKGLAAWQNMCRVCKCLESMFFCHASAEFSEPLICFMFLSCEIFPVPA